MATSSNRNLYFAATVSCLTAALFGYSVGFIGGEIVLPSFLSFFHLNNLTERELASARSWSVTAWIVGALIGVPMGMPVCSRLGRRLCLQLTAVLYVVGAVMQVCSAGNLVMYVSSVDIGRLVNGMGVGAGTLVSPIYISEISPASQRGVLMAGWQVLVQLCALIGFWIAFIAQATLSDRSALQWQVPVAVQLIVGGLLLVGSFGIPESPQYLAEQGQIEAMERSLAWLRRRATTDPQHISERLEIEAAARLCDKLDQQPSFVHELRRKDVRHRLGVGVGLMVAQNMVGLNALNYYAPVIFMSAGFGSVGASLFLTGIFGVVKLISSLAFMFKFVHVKGNRFWLMLGSGVCGVAMLVLAWCVRASPPPEQTENADITAVGVVSVLMVFVFSFFFQISLGSISWNVCAEIFPLRINSTCCAITTCTQWAFQIAIAAMTPPLIARIGWFTYLIYAGCCVLSLLWIGLYVPETRGVAVGKPMDELFGVLSPDDENAVVEVSETTALLGDARQHRSSLTAYT